MELNLLVATPYFIDFLINNLFVSLKNKYFINCDPISIIALGGYGRGELCPYSDIDLLFLVEDKISKDQKHLIEFIYIFCGI